MPPYRVRGALLALKNAATPVFIDLLEWQDPTDSNPPYPHLYHIGIARLALLSSDLSSDYRLQKGVEILSEPATVQADEFHGSRFFCFKDPDGTYLELVENF
jgi:hypothetical protein